MKLDTIMTRYPETVAPTDTLISARDRMVWGGLRHLPVVDNDRVIGVLSDRDIAAHQARTGESLWSSPGDTVQMAMTTPVQTAGPADSVIEAMARIASSKIGCLPITDEGKLVGLVTAIDLMVAEVRAHTESPAKGGPSVADVMTKNPQIVHPGDRLLDAVARMRELQVRHLPVVDDDGIVVGILSDRDVRTAVGDPSRPMPKSNEFRVIGAMSAPVMIVKPTQSIKEVARMFAGFEPGAFPVVDDHRKLLGIVSYVDVLRALA